MLDPFTEVSRNNENNQPIWYLNWDTKKLDKYGNQIIQDVELDGKTGKVLKDSTHTFGEWIPEEYKNESAKENKKLPVYIKPIRRLYSRRMGSLWAKTIWKICL